MKLFQRALIALQLLGAATGGSAEPPAANAVHTTVCELVAKPEEFVGRSVTFHAVVESDGEHLALLLDTSCRRGLRFGLKSAQPRESAETIYEAAWGTDDNGIVGKYVQADFTAILKPTDLPGMFPKPLPYFLDVTEIREVTIKDAKDAE